MASPVRVAEAEFHQAPGHQGGTLVDGDPDRVETALLGCEVGHLEPQLRGSRVGSGTRGCELEMPAADEVHRPDHPLTIAVLVVEPQPQEVLVEVSRRREIPWMDDEA